MATCKKNLIASLKPSYTSHIPQGLFLTTYLKPFSTLLEKQQQVEQSWASVLDIDIFKQTVF